MKKLTRSVLSLRRQGVSIQVCAEIFVQSRDSAALTEFIEQELSNAEKIALEEFRAGLEPSTNP